jgi:hypothetical protein
MGDEGHIADQELERFFQDLRSAFPERTSAQASEHLAAMFETAHLLADKGDPAVRPVSNADGPARQVSRLPKRRGNTMTDRNFLHSRALRALAPAVAAFAVLGAMASASALPHGVQHAASTAASWVGLDLTDGADATTSDATGDDQAPDAFGDASTGSTKDDAVSQDDSQGEDTQDSSDTTESGDNQGEDTSGAGDTTESGDNQGEDTSGDTTQSGDDQGEDNSGSGDTTESGDSQGEDTSGDTGGDTQDQSGGGSDDTSDSNGGDSGQN